MTTLLLEHLVEAIYVIDYNIDFDFMGASYLNTPENRLHLETVCFVRRVPFNDGIGIMRSFKRASQVLKSARVLERRYWYRQANRAIESATQRFGSERAATLANELKIIYSKNYSKKEELNHEYV